MCAVMYNCNSVVELLLKTPNILIEVNLKSDKWSALYFAVYSNNNEALKLLLNVPNINVNTGELVNNSGESAVL